MADRTIAERLQPSLLDRLTDDNPTERTESRDARVIDMRGLRGIIQRDLSWLLNTSNAGSAIDVERFPRAKDSVLNFGVAEVAGEFSTTEKAELIRKAIGRAIARYEPRIKEGSCDVELRAGQDNRQTVVSFDIRADMWAQPLPLELYLRSEVDITTGELSLERVG